MRNDAAPVQNCRPALLRQKIVPLFHGLLCQDLAAKLGVRGLPMIIFYKKGKRIDHFTTANINTIEEAIRDNS